MPTTSQLQNLVHHLEQAKRIAGELADDYDPKKHPGEHVRAVRVWEQCEWMLQPARELEAGV